MRTGALAMALLVVGLAAGGDDAAGKNALAALQGEWKIVRAEAGGKAAPADVLRARVVIAGDRMTFVEGTGRKEEMTIKLDMDKNPHAIDFVPTGAKAKGSKGIFRLTGDRLTLAFAKYTAERPTAFAAPEGTQVMVMELDRVKK